MTKEEFRSHSEEVLTSWEASNRDIPHPCYDCGEPTHVDLMGLCPGCGRVICEDCWVRDHTLDLDADRVLYRCVNQIHTVS